MFAQPRPNRKSNIINITPLIDVVFQLVIFFAVSTTFVEQPAVELVLPHANTSQPARIEQSMVTIDKDGTIFLNSKKVSEPELKQELSESLKKSKEGKLVLQADERVAYKNVVFVMDTARDIGFKNIVAITTGANSNEK